MRAKNREINIFNMSLLDILTGMLGAFLFMMIGMVPFYAKVMRSKLITPEEQKQFEELKKLLDKGLKGPLSPEEAEQLRNELNRLQAENGQLRADKQQLESQLAETKQQLAQALDDVNYWRSDDARITITAQWDSDAADIDIMVMTPTGDILGPKTENLLGRSVKHACSLDSHDQQKISAEGVTILLTSYGSGDYLIFYRVPKGAAPETYASLYGMMMYRETVDKEKDSAKNGFYSLGSAHAATAKPGGLYAWIIFTYDAAKHTIDLKTSMGKLPEGITLPK